MILSRVRKDLIHEAVFSSATKLALTTENETALNTQTFAHRNSISINGILCRSVLFHSFSFLNYVIVRQAKNARYF